MFEILSSAVSVVKKPSISLSIVFTYAFYLTMTHNDYEYSFVALAIVNFCGGIKTLEFISSFFSNIFLIVFSANVYRLLFGLIYEVDYQGAFVRFNRYLNNIGGTFENLFKSLFMVIIVKCVIFVVLNAYDDFVYYDLFKHIGFNINIPAFITFVSLGAVFALYTAYRRYKHWKSEHQYYNQSN
jgi:hypothetical protein